MLTPQQVLEELKQVKYPGLNRDIVSFGFVKDIKVDSTGVTVQLAPSTGNQEVIEQIREAVERTLSSLVTVPVEIVIEHPAPHGPAAQSARTGVPGVKYTVAVASGKGGVGKSTVAVNLALALVNLNKKVGLLDADIYGPSVPLMLGVAGRPQTNDQQRIIPVERHGLKVISMGFFVADGTAVVWRGPMITKMLTEFVKNVEWGELDCMLIDLPPGTGDAQLTMVQQMPLSGGVIVTTPQEVALLDVKRGITMFEQVQTPILGVIENMSYHLCTHCGHRTEIFGHGGGAQMAAQFDIPFLGEVPLMRLIREGGDAGTPLVVADPEHPQSQVFQEIAAKIMAQLEEKPQKQLPVQ